MTQMAQHPEGEQDRQAEPEQAEAPAAEAMAAEAVTEEALTEEAVAEEKDSDIDAMTLPQLDAEIGRLRDRELELRRLRSRPAGLDPTQMTEEASLGMRLRALRRARSILSGILGVPRIRTRRSASG